MKFRPYPCFSALLKAHRDESSLSLSLSRVHKSFFRSLSLSRAHKSVSCLLSLSLALFRARTHLSLALSLAIARKLKFTCICILLSISIPATLDPLQFAYRPNRSTDAISQVLHSSLTHIDSKNGNYVRLLFIDYSSAFNTIVPTKLAVKLSDLNITSSLCDWTQDFLTARPQVVKVGQFTSNSITLNVGAPQGCVLSPLLYSLYTRLRVLSQLHFYR